jgi:biopolymer transport protein ExbD
MGAPSRGKEEVITEINVTPLVDVCLVLVIIFMAVAPFAVQGGIKVLQSHSSAGVGQVSSEENVLVRLNQLGEIRINERLTTLKEFSRELSSALTLSRDKVVIVTADPQNKVKDVVAILDISKQFGAARVAIMKKE